MAEFVLAPDSASSITALRRHPRYVSQATASLAVVVNNAGTATYLNISSPSDCTNGKCSVSIPVSPGSNTFLVSAYSGISGTGSLLSRATVQATIAANTTTIVPAVLDGNIAALTVGLGTPNPPLHTATTIPVTVAAADASGETIVGPGGYLNPVTVTDSDTSGHTKLSTTTLNGPSDTVSLSYDGGYANATVTAGALGAPTASPSPMLVPMAAATETPITSGSTASSIAVGPDGALWFAETGGYLGRITTSGSLTQSLIGSNWNALSIVAGPDGALWMGAQSMTNGTSAIVRRASNGTLSAYPLPTGYGVEAIVVGSDGNLYFNQTGMLGEITTAGTVTMLSPTDPSGYSVHVDSLVATTNGTLWLAEDGQMDVYSLATQAVTASYPAAVSFGASSFGGPISTPVIGPDGNVYFSEFLAAASMTPGGTLAQLYTANYGIVGFMSFTPGGALWFQSNGTLQPVFTRLVPPSTIAVQILDQAAETAVPSSLITSMITGPDGNLWYTRGGYVGRMIP